MEGRARSREEQDDSILLFHDRAGGDAGGSSSKGDVTLVQGCLEALSPKSCKVHFVSGHKKVQIRSYLRQFPPSADTLNPLSLR